jgi:hypothetical protein
LFLYPREGVREPRSPPRLVARGIWIKSGYSHSVRVVFVVLGLLVVGLLAQGVSDSAVGAWIAFGAVVAVVAIWLLGRVGAGPANWPDVFGGD